MIMCSVSQVLQEFAGDTAGFMSKLQSLNIK